jgi:broad specificity phosphatase PhoE
MGWKDEAGMTAARRLVLVTHATTAASSAGRFPGDEPLDPAGLRAADALTHPSRQESPWPARVGPELRCRQTAAALGLAVTVDEALRDRAHGVWAGRSLREVASAEPDAFTAWLTDVHAAPPGGESLAELVQRVGSWLEDRVREHLPGMARRQLAVTHPAVVRAAVVHALGAKPESLRHMDVGPLTRTDVSFRGGRWTVQLLGAYPLPAHNPQGW